MKVKFTTGVDDICKPCKFLLPDGTCMKFPKYNDVLDDALFRHLGLTPGTVMTVRQFLEIVDKKLPGMEEVTMTVAEFDKAEKKDSTPLKPIQKLRWIGLVEGLHKLGISKNADTSPAREKAS